MTRKDASEKVAKLLKLAGSSTNPHEAATAKAQAEKLVAEHGLTDNDLMSDEMGAAFDDLVDRLQKVVAGHPAMPSGMFNQSAVINDVLLKIKNIDDTDKATQLRRIAVGVRTASFLFGDNKVVAEVKVILDTVLKNHNVSV